MNNNLINKLRSAGVRLEIVDGKLKVNARKGVLTPELLEEIKSNKEQLMGLLGKSTQIPKAPISSAYPLTPTQYFMWFTHEHLGGEKAYNITGTLKLEGEIDVDTLEEAFNKVIQRHESLRTVFRENNDEVNQVIVDENVKFKLDVVELPSFSKNDIKLAVEKEYQKSFDLKNDLLVSAKLITNGSNQHILLFVIHHIIGDGWSLQILTKEVMQWYMSLLKGEKLVLPDLAIQYKDYSVWLNNNLKSSYDQKLNYWKTVFSDSPMPIQLPSKGIRPAVKTYNGRLVHQNFSKGLYSAIKAFAKKEQATPFMVLMAGINGLFSRYTGQSDLTLGTTDSGRSKGDLEHHIGLYSNALAVRTKFNPKDSFRNLVQLQKKILLETYNNKEYPFTELVRQLALPVDKSRSPLFDIMVLFQNHKSLGLNDQKGIEGLAVSEYNEVERGVSQQDITFVFVENEEGLTLSIEYNTDIYNDFFINQLLNHLSQFIKTGLEEPDESLVDIEFISKAEKKKMLSEFNSSKKELIENNVIELIKEQVVLHSEKAALIYKGKVLSYQELEHYSNQLANYLVEECVIHLGDLVGVEMERSANTIITIIAVLKAGGVYVPIDPAYPEKRRNYIYEDSQCKMTISEEMLKKDYDRIKKHSHSFKYSFHIDNLAYIIYTSGSTGNPKGVQISHQSMADYVNTFSNYFQLTAEDILLHQASISFDTSIEEIFPILCSGGTLVIQDDEKDFESLFDICQSHNITILSTNPFVLQYLNQVYDKYNFSFKTLISGGDVLKPAYINNIWGKVNVYNTYGPTESTVCASYYKVIQSNETIVPIGKPIANRQIYLVEPGTMKLSPIGIDGELCIGGVGLSEGYLNQPVTTAEKFVDNPFNPGTLIYKSGDLARWMPDGNIEFIGRKDNQVKIRGYRIELEEIELALLSQPGVKQAVALVKERGEDKFIIAYLEGEHLEVEVIYNALAKSLPQYMLPTHLELLEQMPLTANGKLDKKSLLERDEVLISSREYCAPQTDLEKQLTPIWAAVLGVDRLGINDNFFEMGGHSLKVVQLVNRIRKDLGYEIKVKTIFNHPTIAAVAGQLKVSEYTSIPNAALATDYPVTAGQRRLWVLSNFQGGSAAYNIVNVLAFEGDFNYDHFLTAVKKIIARHESLRTSFKENAQGELRQFVAAPESIDFSIPVHQSTKKQSIDSRSIIEAHHGHTFDLAKGPLLKIALIKVEDKKHLALFNLHHIIGDGWSMEILSKEIVQYYNELAIGEKVNLAPLNIQYKDFAKWTLSRERKVEVAKSEAYWKEMFASEIPVLEMPTDFSRPKIKTYNGATVNYTFSKDFNQSLKELVRKEGATLFMALMAGVNGLLYRYTNQKDIVIGTPVAGRSHPDLENQVGLFLNTLAIRTQLVPAASFPELLAKQKEILAQAYAHEEYPFDQLVDSLDLKRDTSRSALFDVMVVLHNQESVFDQSTELSGLKVQPFKKVTRQTSQFDLTFSFRQKKTEIGVDIEYNTDLYSQNYIENLADHLERFVLAGIKNPNQNLDKIDFLSPKEKQVLLFDFNNTTVDFPVGNSLVDLLEKQANETPDAIAIVFEDKEFTYKFVQEHSNQFAHYLLEKYDIQNEDFIGFKLPRDEWMIIALIGILKTGAAYVPLDPKYPQERIAFIESDCSCKMTISPEVMEDFIEGNYSSKLPEVMIKPEQIGYCIYTSGSTGRPKGVRISHHNVVTLMYWSKQEFIATAFDSLYAVTSYCFDLSVFELFFPLVEGKKVRVLENGLAVADFLTKDKNVFINTVPSVISALHQLGVSFENAAAINMAGEPIPTRLSNDLVKLDLELRNLYGPSEDTTYSSIYRINQRHDQSIPIGVPVSNTRFYVLSEAHQLMVRPAIGELFIAGEKLSMGYLNRPELTKEKYISDPFVAGESMYKTGDLVRWLPNGNLEFVGRKDQQIKLRGYRIELGEIEHAITQELNVEQAVVLIKVINDEKYIVAYLCGKNIDIEKISRTIANKIPRYMIPAYYLILDSIPLSPNGKIDKNKLLELEVNSSSTKEIIPAETNSEKMLVSIWEEILEVNQISIDDNFFELGGHSIHITRMLHEINNVFNIKLEMASVFMAQNIQELAEIIDNEILFNKGVKTVDKDQNAESKKSEVWEI